MRLLEESRAAKRNRHSNRIGTVLGVTLIVGAAATLATWFA